MYALTQALSLLSAPRDTTFILGDFNLPDIDWANHITIHDGVDDIFMNCMSTLGMTQFVREPTRLSHSNAENILDLILSSDISSVQISDTLPPISTSDHLLLSFNVFIPHPTSSTPDATDTSSLVPSIHPSLHL